MFVRDLELRRTVRVSVGPEGAQSDGASTVMGISADGSVVLFVSSVNNLVSGDTNGLLDAFVHVGRTCPAPEPWVSLLRRETGRLRPHD